MFINYPPLSRIAATFKLVSLYKTHKPSAKPLEKNPKNESSYVLVPLILGSTITTISTLLILIRSAIIWGKSELATLCNSNTLH
jgi:hypothetical protein